MDQTVGKSLFKSKEEQKISVRHFNFDSENIDELENEINQSFKFIDGEYGKQRVMDVLKKLLEFKDLKSMFTNEQIIRLAMINMPDPSYQINDKDRPNTHFEDSYQMAKLVGDNYYQLKQEFGLSLDKHWLQYLLINHDIGKAGMTSSNLSAQIFNLKDEDRFFRTVYSEYLDLSEDELKEKNLSEADVKMIKILQQGRVFSGKLSVSELLNQIGVNDEEKLKKLQEEGIDLDSKIIDEFYKQHENWDKILKRSLAINKDITDNQRYVFGKIINSHHLVRHESVAETITENMNDLIFVDLLDKSQAFLTREPQMTYLNIIMELKNQSSEFKNQSIKDRYLKAIRKMYPETNNEMFTKDLFKFKELFEKVRKNLADKEQMTEYLNFTQKYQKLFENNEYIKKLKKSRIS